MEEHVIEIATDGKTSITVKGLKGRKCTKATFEIQKALGTTTQDKPTQEMYEPDTTIRNKR